jgi:uncharacterized protein (TIGR03000 family)
MTQLRRLLVVCAALAALAGGAPAGAGEKEEAVKVTRTATERGQESRIRVLLPASDARLSFDGTLTKAQGKERVFRSPALEDGKRYSYLVRAVWYENGQEVSHDMKVVFRAGEDVVISFRR